MLYTDPLFQEWSSSDQIDNSFGSRGTIRTQSLAGHNTFILTIDKDRETRMELIALFRTWLSSKKPTRVVIITPRKDVEAWLRPRDRRFLELGFSVDFPFVHSTAHLTKSTLIRSNEPISILLALNKESMALDPIDWHALKNDILEWATHHCPHLIIPESVNALFSERAPFGHKARASTINSKVEPNIYRFFSPHLSHLREEKFFIDCGIPQEVARLIDRANRHEQGLSLLGILPNQFRRILQASSANFEEPWLDISKHLFWHGYDLWTLRKNRTREFWKDIALDDWKKHKEKGKKDRTNKINTKNLRKRKNKEIMSQCTDPFHFLVKCDNLNKEKPTLCPCSQPHRPQKRTISYDIRNFITSFPTLKCPTLINTEIQVKDNSLSHKKKKYSTKEEKIRDQHDRGKKRKTQYKHDNIKDKIT